MYLCESESGMTFCRICGGWYDSGNCGCSYLSEQSTAAEGRAWSESGATVDDMIAARVTLEGWGQSSAADEAIIAANSIIMYSNARS